MFRYIAITPDDVAPLVHQSPERLTLAEMQTIVGGYIELFQSIETPDGPIDCYCNEEGKLLHLDATVYVPGLQDVIQGPVLIVSNDGQGETVGLTPQQVGRVQLADTGVRLRGPEIAVLAPGEAPPEPRTLYVLLIDAA